MHQFKSAECNIVSIHGLSKDCSLDHSSFDTFDSTQVVREHDMDFSSRS